MTFPASSVPTTRARIFSKAVSLVLEVSSLKGAKPQSSVVPSCSIGMYSTASSTRSRTSSGVSILGSITAITPTKIRWWGFRCLRMILELAGDPAHKRAQCKNFLPSDRGASAANLRSRRRYCGSIQIAPWAGMNPNTPALLWRETRQREIVQVNKAIKEPPGGRPSWPAVLR